MQTATERVINESDTVETFAQRCGRRPYLVWAPQFFSQRLPFHPVVRQLSRELKLFSTINIAGRRLCTRPTVSQKVRRVVQRNFLFCFTRQIKEGRNCFDEVLDYIF